MLDGALDIECVKRAAGERVVEREFLHVVPN